MSLTVDNLTVWLQAMASDPLSLALALAIATFVTEDGALIGGSLLVGSGAASIYVVLPALTVGILVGDIALYLVGWTARGNKFIKRRLPLKKAKKLRHWLKGRETVVLFFSRFMPGTRLLTYTTFGFLRMPLMHFALVMAIAALIWVSALVLFISEIQNALSAIGSLPAAILAGAAAIALIVATPRIARRFGATATLEQASREVRGE
jgi:membrane protein DedA with SNARE-associated domain